MKISEAIAKLKEIRKELWEDNSRVEEWAESGEDLERIDAIDIVLQELEKLRKVNKDLRHKNKELNGMFKVANARAHNLAKELDNTIEYYEDILESY